MNCKNCDTQLIGDFCNQCGQKSKVDRINFSYLLKQVPSSLFQLDHGFFFTVKELLIRPGHSIREFLEGKRVKHYKPIAFLLVTSALYVLSAYLTERNTFFYDMALGFEQGANDRAMESSSEVKDTSLLTWISKYQAYIPLFILPLFSISTYIAFIKSKYNYFEHLVINFYITGQQMIIYFFLGFLFFKENAFMIVPIVLGVIYNFWSFIQLYNNKKIATKIGLILLSYFLFVIGVIGVALIIGIILKTFF